MQEQQPENYRTILAKTGALVVFPKGISMLPLIREGRDCVSIAPLQDPPRPGDILLFETERDNTVKTLLHRLERILPDGRLVMRGLNCTTPEIIAPQCVIGKVVEISNITGHKSLKTDSLRYRLDIARLDILRHLREIRRKLCR